MKPKVLVTGANGFLGSHLLSRLVKDDQFQAVAAFRTLDEQSVQNKDHFVIGNIDEHTNWQTALKNVDVVVHTAARAHIMDDRAINPLSAYLKINLGGTLNLASQAAEAGVSRFVFISSIKVNGEKTALDEPFTVNSNSTPVDPYGISKLQAEQGLKQIVSKTGMELVIIRPPLIYGPGVKGNFSTMIRMVEKGLPLPLGGIENKRSLIAIDNLLDLIITCIEHPAAANQTFLAGDGEDLSTSELLQALAEAMGKPSRLFSVPSWILKAGAVTLGKRTMAERLIESLQVDISHTKNQLGWEPLINVKEGLRRAVSKNSFK